MHTAALEVLRPSVRYNQDDWFDESNSGINALLDEKRNILRHVKTTLIYDKKSYIY